MISKELQEKITLLFLEIGIMKLTIVVLTYNMLIMCLMYCCYMYDSIFASIRKVFPDE